MTTEKALQLTDDEEVVDNMIVETSEDEDEPGTSRRKKKTKSTEAKTEAKTKTSTKPKTAAAPRARGKGKSKQSEVGPEEGPAAAEPTTSGGAALVATPKARGAGSKGRRAKEAEPEHVDADPSKSTPHSALKEDLPKTFKEVEDRLPSFDLPDGIFEQTDPDFDQTMEDVLLTNPPNMLQYVTLRLLWHVTHENPLKVANNAKALGKLEVRQKILRIWQERYEEAAETRPEDFWNDAPEVRVDNDFEDVEMRKEITEWEHGERLDSITGNEQKLIGESRGQWTNLDRFSTDSDSKLARHRYGGVNHTVDKWGEL